MPEPEVLTESCEVCSCTVTRKVVLDEAAPSLTVSVILTAPDWPATDVSVTVRLLLLPPKTIFAGGRIAGAAELAVRVNNEAAVSTSPIVKLSGPLPEPATTV